MTNFTAGDRVQISTPGQTDLGTVVTATLDSDGNRITARQVAVTVENGQGTWGFGPSKLSPVCWNCGGTELQDAGADDTGTPITTCTRCGERQEQE